MYQRHAKRLNHFLLRCLRKLLKIWWQDMIPDTEVLKKAMTQRVHTLLKLSMWPKEMQQRNLRASLKNFNIPTDSWEQAAQDLATWRCLIRKGAAQYEANRICEAERKCRERKARAKGSSSESLQSVFTCSISTRQFRA